MNRRRFALRIATVAAALAAITTLPACQDKPADSTAAPAAKPSAQEIYALAAKGSGFTVGPMMAANTVYVFFDPACPHCAHLWNAAKPLAGRMKVVWMPISLLRSASGPQGAAILAAADPAAAMAQNEASVLARGDGIAVPDGLPDEALNKVKANTELFRQAGAESVPFIVYRNAKTGQYGAQAGAVGTEELAAMVGV
ncbi:MAG: thioredoxin fold domain-containing protein [Pseudomonadota bacterium]